MSDLHKLNTVRRSFPRHHNAEDVLRESDAKFRALASTVPVTIYEFQHTSVGRSFTFVSDKILELAGIRAQDMLADADSFYDLIHPADLDALLLASALAVAAKSRFSHEFRIVKPDGKVVWILANSLQFGGEVDAGVWIGCMEDVTGRKQADLSLKESNRHVLDFIKLTEQQFLHKELLKVQKTESLGALAGGIAHDFNNILIGIMGNISFAQMCLDVEHEARLPLDAAEKAAQRAAALAGQLLTFTKGREPIKRVISVQSLVSEAFSFFLRGTNVQGDIALPPSLHQIEADEGQMSQAFNNIVMNATHAMSGVGTLTVLGENVLLGGDNTLSLHPGPYVKLLFKDNGCGIPDADLQRIFDLYFTTKSGGNGLGLASTLSIVRRHGGNIRVDSEVGVGTTFTLYLPSTGEVAENLGKLRPPPDPHRATL